MAARAKPQDEKVPALRLECEYVTVIPEVSKMKVLRRGRVKALRGRRPRGGQVEPSSTLGESEQCRYAQKKPTKKKSSETMKRHIP